MVDRGRQLPATVVQGTGVEPGPHRRSPRLERKSRPAMQRPARSPKRWSRPCRMPTRRSSRWRMRACQVASRAHHLFWETFLRRSVRRYRLYDEDWPFVFNSYYEAEGERIARFSRGMLSRPTSTKSARRRAHVDAAMAPLFAREELAPLIELGISHEQQHQELLLTDIKHGLFQNPLGAAMWTGDRSPPAGRRLARAFRRDRPHRPSGGRVCVRQ